MLPSKAFKAFRFWIVVPLLIFIEFHLYLGSLKIIFTASSYIIWEVGKVRKILVMVIQKSMTVPIGIQISLC